jgi:hypothetical protein
MDLWSLDGEGMVVPFWRSHTILQVTNTVYWFNWHWWNASFLSYYSFFVVILLQLLVCTTPTNQQQGFEDWIHLDIPFTFVLYVGYIQYTQICSESSQILKSKPRHVKKRHLLFFSQSSRQFPWGHGNTLNRTTRYVHENTYLLTPVLRNVETHIFTNNSNRLHSRAKCILTLFETLFRT